MNEKSLKISIITVCKNAGHVIERTIHSVVQQSYTNVEYIIIDGASEDTTHEIIKKHNGNISVVSEVGKGSTFTISLPLKE